MNKGLIILMTVFTIFFLLIVVFNNIENNKLKKQLVDCKNQKQNILTKISSICKKKIEEEDD